MYLQIHQHFSHCVLLTVLLGLTMDVTSGLGSIQLIPQYPVVNGSVTLSVTGFTGTLEAASWFKGPSTDSQYQILAYFPGSKDPLVTGLLYNPRFIPFSNGSLQIKDLLITDGGNYTVRIQTEKPAEDINVTLTVYVPVTKPKITASIPQSKENDTLTLTCNTLNAKMITWTRSGSRISLQAKLSGDNKTLTFSSIKREDSGEYRCEVQNIASKDSSDPYTITVTYGPDEAQIEGTFYRGLSSPITLSCSADCFPPPEYQWEVNGAVAEQKTNTYNIRNAKSEDQGLYKCVVRNPVTLRTSAASIFVAVTVESIISILGLTFGIIFGVVLTVMGSVFLYKKCVKKRTNGSSANRQEHINVYENAKAAQPKEESSYVDLQFRSEDTYKELKK